MLIMFRAIEHVTVAWQRQRVNIFCTENILHSTHFFIQIQYSCMIRPPAANRFRFEKERPRHSTLSVTYVSQCCPKMALSSFCREPFNCRRKLQETVGCCENNSTSREVQELSRSPTMDSRESFLLTADKTVTEQLNLNV